MNGSCILFAEETDAAQLELEVGGGALVAYSCPAPDKTTDNEDGIAVIPCGEDSVVLVIADGAGGMPGGRRAARTAIAALESSVREHAGDDTGLRTVILNGIEAANLAVRELGTGSATTMTVVAIDGIEARSYQIGDSEALVVGQRGRIRAQTLAHSPTGFAVEAGLLDQREALHHEERHLVSNFVGTSEMRIEIGPGLALNPRDTVLLASDGLMDNVHLDEITEMIRKGPLNAAAASLSNLARRRMTIETQHQPSKPDDLSFILFRKPYRKPALRKPGAGRCGP